jgi:hypothetical protein
MQTLKTYRQAANMSRQRLAHHAAVPIRRLRAAEAGKLRLTDAEVCRIIRAVNNEPRRIAAAIECARTEEIWPAQPSWKWLLTEVQV